MAINKRPLLLIVALSSGTLAGLLALRHLGQDAPLPSAVQEIAVQQVVVAARDLPHGAILGQGDVKLVDWNGAVLPAGYMSSAEMAVGRGLITPMFANEPVLAGKIADKGAGGGLPIVIPEGMRAVSVKVDEVIGVAGFVLPGTRVDVLVTLRSPSSQAGSSTRVILQNVRTLAAGQEIQSDTAGKPQQVTVITLLVTPAQAEDLTLAANEGRIQLALRNTLDGAEAKTGGSDARKLLRGESEARVASPAPRRRAQPAAPPTPVATVEIYRGGIRSEETFKGDRG